VLGKRFFVGMGLTLALAAANAEYIEVYTDSGSVRVGEDIRFYISSDVGQVRIEATRIAARWNETVLVASLDVLAQPIPAVEPWKTGPGWEESYRFAVPPDWQPGLYDFRVRSFSNSNLYQRTLVSVLPESPGAYSRVVVLLNDSTENAYNTWGGKSNYKSLLPDSPAKASRLAFNRPGTRKYQWIDWEFPRWADLVGMRVEYITTLDLHYADDLLDHYDILVLSGHSEYWSREMRGALERFLARGGKLVSLSGNTMWWSVRFEETPGGTMMISCKGGWPGNAECPLDHELFTGYWHRSENPFTPSMNNPETLVMGESSLYGGYVDSHGFLTGAEGYGGYFAQLDAHWFWAGTGVVFGDHVGRVAGIAGYEADSPPLVHEVKGGNLIVDPDASDLPAGIEVLGTTPAANEDHEGYGAITYFTYGQNGGEVFNCGSVDCSKGLGSDPQWRKAVLNVFKRFGAFGQGSPTATDFDGDGIADSDDNCIATVNPEQIDSWSDGTGDACDRHCH